MLMLLMMIIHEDDDEEDDKEDDKEEEDDDDDDDDGDDDADGDYDAVRRQGRLSNDKPNMFPNMPRTALISRMLSSFLAGAFVQKPRLRLNVIVDGPNLGDYRIRNVVLVKVDHP
eukprot:6111311-Amphidinium_carterae.1